MDCAIETGAINLSANWVGENEGYYWKSAQGYYVYWGFDGRYSEGYYVPL